MIASKKGAVGAQKIMVLVISLLIAGVFVASTVNDVFAPLFNVDTTNGTPAWLPTVLILTIAAVLVLAFVKMIPR